MKKFLALLSIFTLLTAFTCENEALDNDIDSSTDNNENLVGMWSLQEFEVSVSTSTNFEGQVISSDIDVYSTEVNYTLEFAENTFTTNGNYTYHTTIVVNGDEVSNEPYSLDDVTGSGTYSTDGNEMTVDGSFFEFNFEGMDESITEGEQTGTFQLSDDGQTLIFLQDETETQNDPTTGIVITSSTVSSSVWSRQ